MIHIDHLNVTFPLQINVFGGSDITLMSMAGVGAGIVLKNWKTLFLMSTNWLHAWNRRNMHVICL